MRRMILGAVACGVIAWSAVSTAQSTKDALPMGATGFTCRWGGPEGGPPSPSGRGMNYEIENGQLITQMSGDTWTILQNNPSGFIATAAESEFVPRLNKNIVASDSMAIDRTTGRAVLALGRADMPFGNGNDAVNQGVCAVTSSPR